MNNRNFKVKKPFSGDAYVLKQDVLRNIVGVLKMEELVVNNADVNNAGILVKLMHR